MSHNVLVDHANLIEKTVSIGTFGALDVANVDNKVNFDIIKFLEEPFVFDRDKYTGDDNLVILCRTMEKVVKVKLWQQVDQ